jgi:hypothetical protein
MKKIIIITGDELRHRYFRRVLALTPDIDVLASYCEGTEKSLENRIIGDANASELMQRHAMLRKQSEQDFFGAFLDSAPDRSNPIPIAKGDINDPAIIARIIEANPDLLICYGTSLIKSPLLDVFRGRFLNAHLGLSPYYRGSGTNIWPLIDGKPELVGATFLHMDAGIDTGDIIHQIRARIVPGDSPHQVGNRLIGDMAATFANIVSNWDRIEPLPQPDKKAGKLCTRKDFDRSACEALYAQFESGLIDRYLAQRPQRLQNAPILANPAIRDVQS